MNATQHPAAQAAPSFRMSQAAYDAFVKKLPGISISEATTPLQVSFQLGIQRCLELLRKEHVV